MPQAKRYRFSYDDQELARMGRILGHPARIVILEKLAREGALAFESIQMIIPLDRTTVSGHLQELIKQGLIELVDQSGRGTAYRLNELAFEAMREILGRFVEIEG